MAQSKDDRIYEQGVRDGQKADFVDQAVNSLTKGVALTDQSRREGEIYQSGFDFGVDHSSGSSDSGSSSSSSSTCYISTACVAARGLPDNARQLEVLRRFRDEYVAHRPDGPDLIARYYAAAPGILASIGARADSQQLLRAVFEELVEPSVQMIEAGEFEQALALYRAIVTRLEHEHAG